jgi:hypothetical protein
MLLVGWQRSRLLVESSQGSPGWWFVGLVAGAGLRDWHLGFRAGAGFRD